MSEQHQKDLTRAARAKELMENPFMVEAFEKLESTILEAWKNSHSDDSQARDNAYLMHRLLQNLKQEFQRAIATGKSVEKELLNTKDSKLRKLLP